MYVIYDCNDDELATHFDLDEARRIVRRESRKISSVQWRTGCGAEKDMSDVFAQMLAEDLLAEGYDPRGWEFVESNLDDTTLWNMEGRAAIEADETAHAYDHTVTTVQGYLEGQRL